MSASNAATAPALTTLVRANLAAQSAEQLALAVAPLIAALHLQASAAQTAWLQAAQTLPFLLLALPAGLLADRVSRPRLMGWAEWLRAATLVALAGLWLHAQLNLGWLALLGALGACGTVAYSVAAPALVPALVPPGGLTHANRQLELSRSLALALGPMLAGLLYDRAGAGLVLGLACAMSAYAAARMGRLPDAPRAAGRAPSPWRMLGEGLQFVAGHVWLRPIVLTAVFFNTAWFVLQGIYVVYAARHLALSAAQIGLTLGLYGAGMVGGAWLAPALARRFAFGTLVAAGPACAFGAALLLLASWAWPTLWLVAPAFVLFGAGPILWTITTTSLRQVVTPPGMLGRVSALILTATHGARPLGAAIGALVAARAGIDAALCVSAAGFAIQLGILWRSPVRRLAALPAH